MKTFTSAIVVAVLACGIAAAAQEESRLPEATKEVVLRRLITISFQARRYSPIPDYYLELRAAGATLTLDDHLRWGKALELAGRKIEDVALFEINEAFAAQAVACARELGLDEDIVNVYGSGISLGHPIAATGARMVTSAIYELRRRGGGIGVLSMCAGGGMGAAMVIEVA